MRFVPHTSRKQLVIVHWIEPIGRDESLRFGALPSASTITKRVLKALSIFAGGPNLLFSGPETKRFALLLPHSCAILNFNCPLKPPVRPWFSLHAQFR